MLVKVTHQIPMKALECKHDFLELRLR